ncbi:hypothetical protein O6H91_06G077700 [Diphasiastrum complanatum]|uniref:Uncharacterized protein n=1 Tax=Diphasiastrum complanatum TaxID=34168 RepID=A0ACC2DFJ7_DIPCM|nr:hypothetical protein O6H91_06G077700 [Diphasiastrum complanatum]
MRLGFSENCCSYAQATLISLLILLIALYFQSSHGQIVERLLPGNTLQANQTLVSKNGDFALGFFPVGGPDRNYLGVSYGLSNSTHIWSANRNNPARVGAYLKFSMDGNVVVSNPDQTTVWMSGTSGMNVSSMVMEDSGNLVLNHNSGKMIWQSFDHPTDTWVPGMSMYLGSNLTSSKSTVDPGAGRFSMQMLPTTAFVSLWNKTTQYWSSGIWNRNAFAGVPEMSQNYFYDFSFLNDSGRPYFTWSEKKATHYSHFSLESDGIIRVHTWDSINAQWYTIWTQPKDPCQVDHLCGQNGICNGNTVTFCSCPQGFKAVDPTGWSQGDWSLGCVANFTVECSATQFSILQNTAYDQGSGAGTARAYSGHDQAWCQSQCVKDCACLGFSFDGSTGNCSLQFGPFFNGKTSPYIDQNFFLRVQSSTTQSLGNKKSSRVWVIGLGVAVGSAVLLLIALFVWQIFLRKCIPERENSEYSSGILKKFSYKELRTATNNFSEKIGSGGFGSVYKGCLQDQTKVGVKKLHNMRQGDKDFRAEVSTLGMIQHVNLVRLRGFCADHENRLLVYDYMPNGSLNSLLFSSPGAQQQVVLDWDTRFSIALGTARGITYLHEECRSCIIHCDIKPENVLLDADFCPKVSDFGLAKLMGREFSRVITSMRGTRGYLAPEWLSSLPVTAKADVYSYGMTLLEIISGRRNIDANTNLEKWFFPLWACQRARLGDYPSVADSKLCGNFNEEQLKRAILVALWCIQDEETSRPAMGRVVQMLEGTLEVDDAPFPKSLLLLEVERSQSPLHLSILSMPKSEGEEEEYTFSMDFMN